MSVNDWTDPDLLEEINEYGEAIEAVLNREVGSADTFLQGAPRGQLMCRREECNMGNLITDAMYWACTEELGEDALNTPIIAVMNSGGIRASIDEGD